MSTGQNMRIAVYPGTFDPITNGHIDVIQRGLRVFDKVIVGVGSNPNKHALFSMDERLDMIERTVAHNGSVSVEAFNGLLVDFARDKGACAILRGLRAVSDFDFELQRALMNRKLDRDIETVFLMTGFRWIFISSTIVKEAAKFGANLTGLVPDLVAKRLKEKFSH